MSRDPTHRQRKEVGGKGAPKEARDQIVRLAADGWEFLGSTHSGHLKLTHVSGATIRIAKTPSDSRTRANELAMARARVRERMA